MEKRWQMLWRRGAKRRGWEGRWNVERRENGRPSKWKNSTGVNDREEEIAVRSVITIAEAIIPEAHGQRYFFVFVGVVASVVVLGGGGQRGGGGGEG